MTGRVGEPLAADLCEHGGGDRDSNFGIRDFNACRTANYTVSRVPARTYFFPQRLSGTVARVSAEVNTAYLLQYCP